MPLPRVLGTLGVIVSCAVEPLIELVMLSTPRPLDRTDRLASPSLSTAVTVCAGGAVVESGAAASNRTDWVDSWICRDTLLSLPPPEQAPSDRSNATPAIRRAPWK